MGAKGHSINQTDISASYIVLATLCDNVTNFVADINARKASMLEAIGSGSIDNQSSADLEAICQDLTGVTRKIGDKITETKKVLNKSLEASKAISDKAKNRGNVARENIGRVGSKLGGKV